MTAPTRAVVAWSSGKDSAHAFHLASHSNELEIAGILTTLSEDLARVSMHGVREELLDRQIEALGVPATKVWIPSPCPNEIYEKRMAEAMEKLQSSGVTHVVFGDLFLEDIRAYREAQLSRIDMHCQFPLWQRDTAQLAREMLDSGLDAVVACVDPRVLDRSFAGRAFDETFLAEIEGNVDPCGENGEFHTVVIGSPMFERSIPVRVGDVVERDGLVYADIVPEPEREAGPRSGDKGNCTERGS